MKQKIVTGVYLSVAISLIFHIGFGLALSFAPKEKPALSTENVEVVFVDSNDQQKQQIVEQDLKPLNDETPEKTKFLGRHNQKVVKETKAARSGDFNNKVGGKPQQARKPEKPKAKGKLPSLKKLIPSFNHQAYKPSQNQGAGSVSQTSDHLKDTEVADPKAGNHRSLARPQIELLAARVSALNECFY